MQDELFLVPIGNELRRFRENLNQDEEKLEHNLHLFLNWLTFQKHLPQNCGHNFLRNYIVCCKGDLEKAKKKYKNYSYAKVTNKEIFSERNITPEGDLKCLDFAYGLALPKMTPDGRRIGLLKIHNPDAYELLPIIRYLGILLDYMFHRDTMLAGQEVIIDFECVQPRHYSKLFSLMFFKYLKLVFHIYPDRLKRIILVACHPYLEKGINICKTVMPEKIANRIMAVKDSNELQKLIPASCLSSDYGGSLKSMRELGSLWRKHLEESKEFFEIISKDVPTGPIPKEYASLENEFGVDGSFRKLNID